MNAALLAGALRAQARLDVVSTAGLAGLYDLTRVNLLGFSEFQNEASAVGTGGVSTRTPEVKNVPGVGNIGGHTVTAAATSDVIYFKNNFNYLVPVAGKRYTLSYYYTGTAINCGKLPISCNVDGVSYSLGVSGWQTANSEITLPNQVSATPIRGELVLPPLPAGAITGNLAIGLPYRTVANFTFWWGGLQLNEGVTSLPYEKTGDPQVVYDSSVKGLNLIPAPEDFSSASWGKNTSGTGIAAVITPNAETAPDGTLTAARFAFDIGAGATSNDFSQVLVSGTAITGDSVLSAWLRTTDGSTKLMSLVSPSGGNLTIVVTPTWQRFASSGNNATPSSFLFRLRLRGSEGTAASASVAIWHPMTNAGLTALPYEHAPANGILGATASAEATDPLITPTGLVFDGADDRVTTPAILSAPSAGITLCAVMTPTGNSSGGYHGLLAGMAGVARHPRLLVADDKKTIRAHWSPTMDHIVQVLTPLNGPDLYLATYDGVTSKIYANGVLVGQLAIPPNFTYVSGGVGYLGYGASDASLYALKGVLHYASAYTRALSGKEVRGLYRTLKKSLAARGVTLS